MHTSDHLMIADDSAQQSRPGAAQPCGCSARLSNAAYGLVMKALFHPRFSPARMRRHFEFFAATPAATLQRKFPAVRFEPFEVPGVRAESIIAIPEPPRVIVYLHGGGYVSGSIATYRRRAMKLSYRCRAEVVMPEYRLAPEYPFPAALEDAAATWGAVTRRFPDRPVFLAGDSAGGGLALSLASLLRDQGARAPAGIIAMSPWTDLALHGESMERNRRRDCWLKRAQLAEWSALYRDARAAEESLISPLYADLRGMPSLLLFAGDQEVLLDDARRLAVRARAQGVEVEEHIGVGMQHDWMLTLPWLAQSARAWDAMRRFVDAKAA